jgi:hypothetical protein
VRGKAVISNLVVVGLWLAAAPVAAAPSASFVDVRIESVELGNVATGEAFVRRFGGEESEPDAGFSLYRYLNASKTEVLDLVMHPGGVRYEFMEFRLRRTKTSESKSSPVVAVDSFRTGRGLRLGLTAEEVLRILGAPHQQTSSGKRRTLQYRCTSRVTCPVLKLVNMPEYYGTYSFVSGILVSIESGYMYP